MKVNSKTFGRTKPRKVSTIKRTTRPIHRREIFSVMNHFIKEGKPERIGPFLLDRGVAPCVAREWHNEPARRKHAEAFHSEKFIRKETSPVTERGSFGRRIIKTTYEFGREIVQHATKGLRTYRSAV